MFAEKKASISQYCTHKQKHSCKTSSCLSNVFRKLETQKQTKWELILHVSAQSVIICLCAFASSHQLHWFAALSSWLHILSQCLHAFLTFVNVVLVFTSQRNQKINFHIVANQLWKKKILFLCRLFLDFYTLWNLNGRSG